MNLSSCAMIVTGAASGLGAATAHMICEGGGKVLLADVSEAGESLARQLGPNAAYKSTDVASADSAAACINAALEKFGKITGLVNCAGIAIGEKVLGKNGPHDLATFEKVVRVNLIGTFNMTRLVVEAMVNAREHGQGESGVIVNTASIAAFDGMVGQSAYSASKGGVVGMTLPIAREFARFGIRVVTIAPGVFDTSMMQNMTAQVRDQLAGGVPFPKRLGRVSEYAAMVRHVVENEYLNGAVIRLDGALRMGAGGGG